jgi:hypothetical protein
MMRTVLVAAALMSLVQAPDGDSVLRGAGVEVPRRGGAEAAFDRWIRPPEPVPPTAFAELLVGMGPVGSSSRIRCTYAFGVLAGRSGRNIPPGPMQGAGIALIQMMNTDDNRIRVAAARVAGRVFAAPIDGGPAPVRPAGLEAALMVLLNEPREDEQLAAIEALGMLREIAAVPTIVDRFKDSRARNREEMAVAALVALARIGDPAAEPLVRELVNDNWADNDDDSGMAAAYARERFLKDGSAARLKAELDDGAVGRIARVYLEELGIREP